MYHIDVLMALNVTRIWINRLFGPAQTVWQFLPFLVTFHAVTRYVLGDMEYKKLEGGREWIDATLTVWLFHSVLNKAWQPLTMTHAMK